MAIAQFMIGADTVSLVNIEDLGLPEPQWEFRPWSQSVPLGDGSVRGQGAPVAVWRWRFLTQAQRAQLRAYCPGKSASVAVQTLDNEHNYVIYRGIMLWPDSETWQGRKTIDFAVEFRQLTT